MQFCDIRITKQPLDRGMSCRFSRTEGAVVDFFGVVRSIENERLIDGIEYEAFEAMAERQLALIADEAKDRYGLVSVIIHHRIGLVRGRRSFFVRAGDSTPPSCRLRGKQPDHRAAETSCSDLETSCLRECSDRMNLPNQLTILRLILTLPFVAALSLQFPGAKLLALVLFIVSSVTDYADGYIARKFKLITDFGKSDGSAGR